MKKNKKAKTVIVRGKEEPESIKFRLRVDGRTVFKRWPFKNYFYIKEEDYEDVKYAIEKYIEDTETITDKFGNDFTKLILKNNFHRYFCKRDLEDLDIETFEADISSVPRFRIINDLSWQDYNQLKIGYFDIETDDRCILEFDMKQKVIAKTPITSCAIGDQKWKKGNIKYFKTKDPDDKTKVSETILLKQILDEFKKYDVISGWNANGFDIPYIRQRQELLGLNDYFDWDFINHLDDMDIIKRTKNLSSYSLDNVSKKILGDEKIKFIDNFTEPVRDKEGKFMKLFKTNPNLFEAYNKKDVELMQLIEQQMKNYKPKHTLMKLTQTNIRESIYNSVLVDRLYLIKAFKKKVICKSKPNKQEIERRKTQLRPGGGYTFCYKPGIHWNVNMYDFKSHYPLVIMTFNISPETYVKNFKVDIDELRKIFLEEELDLIKFALTIKSNFIGVTGKIKKSYYNKIDKYIKEKNYNFDLNELMFKFIKLYKAEKVKKYCDDNNYIFTPADLNNDKTGWTLHPHRLFLKEMGIYPQMNYEVLKKRDEVKKIMNEKLSKDISFRGSDEYERLNHEQNGLKLLGNASFGVLGYISTRFYDYDTVDSVTTSARWIMKKSIIHAKNKGYKVIQGDSVTKNTNIRVNGKYVEIEKFFNENKAYITKTINGKEIKDIYDQKILTPSLKITNIKGIGIMNLGVDYDRVYVMNKFIKKIIRHKTNKIIYRITTDSGKFVDVTQDHSLLVRRNSKVVNILTKDVKIGDAVYTFTPLSTIYKEEIIDVEKINYNGYVYDLEVDEFHNFIANKVFVHNTDSFFTTIEAENEEDRINKTKKLNIEFYKLFKEIMPYFNTNFNIERKNPETNKIEKLNFFTHLKWEHLWKGFIAVAKKRYYYLEEFRDEKGKVDLKVGTTGGAFKKSDTNPLASKLQKQLVSDILFKKYDKIIWRKNILDLKQKCFNYMLETKYLVFSKKLTKSFSEYGKPMIDSRTGKQKKTKDGKLRFAPISAHINMAMRLSKTGTIFNVGEAIEFIIAKPKEEIIKTVLKSGKIKTRVKKETKQTAISIEEYEAGKKYDSEMYWRRIITPLIEILSVVYPKDTFEYFKDCWNMSENQIKREIEKLIEE